MVYIGPTKSLCQERVKSWNARFAGFSMRCSLPTMSISDYLLGGELTGDTDGRDGAVLRDNDLIITTPEKWDAVTRKSKDFSRFTDLIRLLLVQNLQLRRV